jgi:IMP and pyridine-specific 5'-nucleotidase
MSSLRLKEQDELISHIRRLYSDARKGGSARAVHSAFSTAQQQLDDHYAKRGSGEPSLLTPTCPSISPLFLRLDLLGALAELDATAHLTSRVHVPPTFSEVRSVLNLAVVAACAPSLQLLTLDADETLYSDGGNLSFDAPTIPHLIRLMRMGVRVAVVTAAAYPGMPERYENRLAGLLSAMAFAVDAGAPPGPLVDNFMVMGGQCNCACPPRCLCPPGSLQLTPLHL